MTDTRTNPPNEPPGLLVSVRNAEEASVALGAGADVIDVKEPSRGALGAPDLETAQEVVSKVGRRRAVTVAAGELVELEAEYLNALLGMPNLKLVKLGSSGLQAHNLRRSLGGLAKHGSLQKQLAITAYADHAAARAPRPEDLVSEALSLGLRWIVLDTWDKSGGNLFDHITAERVSTLISMARRHDAKITLAGGLDLSGVAAAGALWPTLVGVRGAACERGRRGVISGERVARLRSVLQTAASEATIPGSGPHRRRASQPSLGEQRAEV